MLKMGTTVAARTAESDVVKLTKKAKATDKPKQAQGHPLYITMVTRAISALAEPKGSSRAAILKYILQNYDVGSDRKKLSMHLVDNLKKATERGILLDSGYGIMGRYRLGGAAARKTAKKLAETKAKLSKKATTIKKIVKKNAASVENKTTSKKANLKTAKNGAATLEVKSLKETSVKSIMANSNSAPSQTEHKRDAIGGGKSDQAPLKEKEEEEPTPRIFLPETLIKILHADFNRAESNVAIKEKVTVHQILKEFYAKKAALEEEEMMVEVQYAGEKKVMEKTTKYNIIMFVQMIEGLINALATILSVEKDKHQIQRLEEEFLKENQANNGAFMPSKHFGVIYLLRLFVKLNRRPNSMRACDRYSFFKHGSEFLKHLLENIDRYYDAKTDNPADYSGDSTA